MDNSREVVATLPRSKAGTRVVENATHDVDQVVLVRPAGGRVASLNAPPGFAVITPTGYEFMPARRWLTDLHDRGHRPATVRSYANSLARYLYYVWDRGLNWAAPVDPTLAEFETWALQPGALQSQQPYAELTVVHTAHTVRAFFDFEHAQQRLESNTAADEAQRVVQTRARRRGRRPRSSSTTSLNPLTPAEIEHYFWLLGNNRDRAVVATWSSTDVRAQELLLLTGQQIDFERQKVSVVRNGRDLDMSVPLPAMAWLGLYFTERGVPNADDAVWLSLRGNVDHPERLKLVALRAVLAHARDLLRPTGRTLEDLGNALRDQPMAVVVPPLTLLSRLLKASE